MTEKINTKQLKQISTDGNLGTSDVLLPTQNAVKTYVDATANNLQSEINDLSGRGRFLSIWNCATGLAETNPTESPYPYKAGDYFTVGTVDSTTNYKPDGSSYTTGVASTTVETNEVHVDDTYFYDGTTWKLQANSQRAYTFSGIAGSPYDNTALSNALNDKVDETSTANQVYGTDNNGDQTTYNITDFGAVDDVQVDGVSVVTSKIANIDLTNYVTLSTTQAITGTKTFKAEILSWNNITFESAQANPIIRGMSGANYRNMITRTNSASAIDVGNTSDTINLKGSGTRPTYNSNDLALYSDVPSLTGYIQNTATGTDSLTVLGTATSATNALNVGTGAGASGNNAVAYGNYASAEGEGSIAIGSDSSTTYRARTTHKGNIAIGHDAYAINDKNSIAIGESAHANGKNIIQLGTGNNTSNNTFQVASYQLLDTSTGLIPDARISTNITRNADLATVATTGDYDDLLNKPTIPTVNNPTITITQGGVTKGSFSLNQASGDTIALDAGGGGISNIDNITITTNADDEIQAVATVNANTAAGATNPVYDWVGTLAEYNAQDIENQHPDWMCYITDDVSGGTSVYTKTEVDNIASGKANVALDNLTSAGKAVCANMAMPSGTYNALTLGASGTTYTAPSDGYFAFYTDSITTSILANYGGLYGNVSVNSSGFSNWNFLPVKKGTIVILYYGVLGSNSHLYFVYAVGAQ